MVDGKLCVASGRDGGSVDYFNATILPMGAGVEGNRAVTVP